MGKDLNELASYFLPLAKDLIRLGNEAGLDVVIITTGRTPAEQEQKIAQGVSWVTRSKHEPQPPEGLSEAIDLCPRSLLTEKGWAPASPLWQQLGAIGEELGLRWGGRWKQRDCCHFEFVHPTVNMELIES